MLPDRRHMIFPVRWFDLGEPPRLGLAVVGRLSQAYGFQVSLRSSAYGGVRAVLVVPQELITTAASATGLAHGIGASSGPRPALPVTDERPARPVTGPSSPDDDVPVVTERTALGLPQRRRKAPVTAPAAAPEPGRRRLPLLGPGARPARSAVSLSEPY